MKVGKEWMNISDMMAGLMMIFLFISISFMLDIQKEQETIKKIVMTYRQSQQALNKKLNKEFSKDLGIWEAEITEDNIFRFKSPEVLFKSGSSEISAKFKDILDDFFPRYIHILTSEKYKNEVDEIRIEGHTSSHWENTKSKEEIYLNNMMLSQQRASNVLNYGYKSEYYIIKSNRAWLETKLRANGMSFSKIIYKKNGKQDYQKSRRVEFKVLTKAQEKIYKIIEQFQ